MEEENYFERIESYLTGTLTQEERTAFEQDLLNKPELKEDTEMHKLALSTIELEISNDLKAKMGNWLNEEEEKIVADPSKFKIRSLFKPLAIAASLLLLVSAGLNFYANQQFSNEAIVSEMTDAHEETSLRSVRSQEGIQVANLKGEITNAYQNNDLKKLESFKHPIADYHAALLLRKKGQYNDALSKFKDVIKNNNPEYQLHSKMEFIRTALLNNTYNEEAKTMLLELKDGQNDYSKVAAELYKKLNTPLRRMFIS
jgi:hypothetical protein